MPIEINSRYQCFNFVRSLPDFEILPEEGDAIESTVSIVSMSVSSLDIGLLLLHHSITSSEVSMKLENFFDFLIKNKFKFSWVLPETYTNTRRFCLKLSKVISVFQLFFNCCCCLTLGVCILLCRVEKWNYYVMWRCFTFFGWLVAFLSYFSNSFSECSFLFNFWNHLNVHCSELRLFQLHLHVVCALVSHAQFNCCLAEERVRRRRTTLLLLV